MKKKILMLALSLVVTGSVMAAALTLNKVASAQSAPPAATQTTSTQSKTTQDKSQTAPKAKEAEKAAADESKESEAKETKAKETKAKEADENLPGGGHADPDGVDVNHQFDGIE